MNSGFSEMCGAIAAGLVLSVGLGVQVVARLQADAWGLPCPAPIAPAVAPIVSIGLARCCRGATGR